MTIKVKLLEPIEGYSDIAEYRNPRRGDMFHDGDTVEVVATNQDYPWLILTPIPKWRPATLEDAIRAIKGETVKARFKDKDYKIWKESELTGYDKCDYCPWRSTDSCHEECEVLDV